jgi:hypothetical protein
MKTLPCVCLAVWAIGTLSSCSADRRELSRSSSPDAKLVAILMESSGGTEGSVSDELYIDEIRASRELDKPVYSGPHCDGLSFFWTNDYTLEVHYRTPCSISHFTNRWYRPTDLAVGRAIPIEVILIRG